MKGFRHKTPIQIRFKDIDLFGHVNNANHFTYLESARVKYFNEIVGEEVNWSRQGFILAKATIDYRLPILFKDNTCVYTKCSRFGTRSFDLSHCIVKEQDGQETILAEGTTVIVCFDYDKGETIPVPGDWKRKIQEFEK